jgi:hypothetical protein
MSNPVNLGSGRDLRAATTCQVCKETFEKTLEGADVCGACQVAMAIVYHYEAYLYQRWGILRIGVG